MFDRSADALVRTATFAWLSQQVSQYGDVLPRTLLAEGLAIAGERVPLLGPQGIFKPRVLDAPLSITSAPRGPYDDAFASDGLLRYRYRGTDIEHPDNRGLRFAMKERLPLVYLFGLVPGRYLATWPVFIVADRPAELSFTVAVDDSAYAAVRPEFAFEDAVADETAAPRRAYITAVAKVRLHQRAFREQVLAAYQRQCALCRFKHESLLDAAHIIPDSEPEGQPRVQNGLALCTLHHGAFDRYFVGIRPDFTIEVRGDILLEHDGPTLKHAIQGLHGTPLYLPKQVALRPDQDLLALRYQRFKASAA